MNTSTKCAAQYIRMSTDRQDLSPIIQKEAIAAFASAQGVEVIRTYEDSGKSGVQISNRPKLRQLLSDVSNGPPFSEVLVYDVSRWGRFQDADAAAYYEYHCRLHGVQVIYVGESFANDQTATSVLVKSMRRVMAAEYSRDIAWKSRAGQQRVIDMGFHMGALPPLGYRRCSVSADRTQRSELQHGQRKATLTDRVEWVLAPSPEVALVRRICSAYAAGFGLEEIAGLVQADGWRTEKGRSVTTRSIKVLLRHEALVGNFVWGVKSKGGKIIKCPASRMNGSVPRIIDDTTWELIQGRLRSDIADQPAHRVGSGSLTGISKTQKPRQLSLPFGSALPSSYRRSLGSAQQLRDHTREFGRALCSALSSVGMPAAFDTRTNVLTFWAARVRIRLMWPSDANTWTLERSRSIHNTDHLLLARMTGLCSPLDFLFVPSPIALTVLPRFLHRDIPRSLAPYFCRSPRELKERLAKILESRSRRAGSSSIGQTNAHSSRPEGT